MDFGRTRPSLPAFSEVWEASRMSGDRQQSPLQSVLQAAIARSGKARDHFDSILQERLGTTGKPIYDIMRGKSRKPALATLEAIGDVLSVDRDTLLAALRGENVSLPANRPSSTDDDAVEIISLDLSLSMGPGTMIEEFVEGEPVLMGLRFLQGITRTPSDRLRLVRGIGDSMEPTLRTGDRVMVDINERQLSRPHGVYWIDHLGTHGIKRLRASGRGKIMVMSDNPLVSDYEVDAQDLRIEGRVIWFAREL